MDFFQEIYNFFDSGIYDFVKEIFVWLNYKLLIWKITSMLFMLDVAYGLFNLIIADLKLAERLANVLSMIPADTKSLLEFFNVFTGLSWMFQALGTKVVLKLMNM